MKSENIVQTDQAMDIPEQAIPDSIIAQRVNSLSGYPAEKLEHYAEVTRNLIAWEAVRLNERTTWLLQLQGLLFAALAFAWDKNRQLIYLLAVVGIASSAAIGKALASAITACARLEDDWKLRGKNYDGPRIIGLGRNEGWRYNTELILHPGYTLPMIFILAWIIVICIRLTT